MVGRRLESNFGPDKAAFWLMNGAAKGEPKRVVVFQHAVIPAGLPPMPLIGVRQ